MEISREEARFASKPFRLQENMGSRVVVEVLPVSKDLSALQIGPGSHIIVQINDDALQVAELWRIQNASANPVDAGPLHFPLPEAAVSITPGQSSQPSFTIEGHDAVWKGPVPRVTGTTMELL